MTRASSSTVSGPVSNVIIEKLTEAFAPSHLEVRNESYMHNVYVQPYSLSHYRIIYLQLLFHHIFLLSTDRPTQKHTLK
jgi:stress-induced morphogen